MKNLIGKEVIIKETGQKGEIIGGNDNAQLSFYVQLEGEEEPRMYASEDIQLVEDLKQVEATPASVFGALVDSLNEKYPSVDVIGNYDNKKGRGVIQVRAYQDNSKVPTIFRSIEVKLEEDENGFDFIFYNNYGDITDIEHEIELGIDIMERRLLKKAKKRARKIA